MTQVVLVTGITSFLGAHVVLTFLRHGWTVRGTLRSEAKKGAVLAIPEYEEYIKSGKLELHITGDLVDGEYSEAIKSVDAVVHVASPVEFGDKEFTESHLAPAVRGTRGVLDAAVREPSVKAVVMTSTIGAVGDYRKMPWDQVGVTVTEEDWNPHTAEDMEKILNGGAGKGAFPDGYLFYMTGKKYGELEAWKIQKESGAKWSLATMNCTMLWGPPIQPQSSLSSGGMSTEFVWAILKGPKEAPIAPTYYPYYVDVRDAAEAHYEAIVRGAQGRFLLAAEPFDYQEMADMAREWYPELKDRIVLGKPGRYIYRDTGVYTVSNDKSQKVLGIKYRPKKETFKDEMDRLLELERQGLN